MVSVEEVAKLLEEQLDYWMVRRAVKEEVIKPKFKSTNLEESIWKMMVRSRCCDILIYAFYAPAMHA